jgi:hypothetical protein
MSLTVFYACSDIKCAHFASSHEGFLTLQIKKNTCQKIYVFPFRLHNKEAAEDNCIMGIVINLYSSPNIIKEIK